MIVAALAWFGFGIVAGLAILILLYIVGDIAADAFWDRDD